MKFFFTLIFASLVFSNAQAGNAVKVRKNDGSTSFVRLLPVKIDRSHIDVVKQRFIKEREKNPGRTESLPASYTLDDKLLSPVRNQGKRMSCVYFATMAILESYYVRHHAMPDIDLSEQCLLGVRNWMADSGDYEGQDRPGSRPDPNGDFPQSVVRTITKYGVPREGVFSGVDCVYNAAKVTSIPLNDYEQVFDESQSDQKSRAYGKGARFNLDRSPTIEKILTLLNQNVPVQVTIFVYEEFRKTPHWRRDIGTTIIGGHSIVLTGYTHDQNRNLIFKFKNSWGSDWGNQGYGTIDEKTIVTSWARNPGFDVINSL